MAVAVAAFPETGTVLPRLVKKLLELTDRNGDGLRYLFLSGFYLLDHSNGSPLYLLQHILQLRFLDDSLNHGYYLLLARLRSHLRLLNLPHPPHHLSPRLLHNLQLDDDFLNGLLFFPQNCLFLFHSFDSEFNLSLFSFLHY